jgi:hypothetical protein
VAISTLLFDFDDVAFGVHQDVLAASIDGHFRFVVRLAFLDLSREKPLIVAPEIQRPQFFSTAAGN